MYVTRPRCKHFISPSGKLRPSNLTCSSPVGHDVEKVQEFPLSKEDSTGLEAMPFPPQDLSHLHEQVTVHTVGTEKSQPLTWKDTRQLAIWPLSLMRQPTMPSGSPYIATVMCHNKDAVLKACDLGFPITGLSPPDLREDIFTYRGYWVRSLGLYCDFDFLWRFFHSFICFKRIHDCWLQHFSDDCLKTHVSDSNI